MSAYALPGLFPPLTSSTNLPKEWAVHREIASYKKTIDMSEEKEGDSSLTCDCQIRVKDATIDSAKLILALVSSASKSNQRSKKQCSQNQRGRASSAWCSPQEEAVHVTLSVTQSGRSYTAVRSLPCIVQLRNALFREQQQQQQHSPSCATKAVIPHVPRLDDEQQGDDTRAVGRGFAGLQALVRSYAPVLEAWLRNVSSLVGRSAALQQFLWEPLPCRHYYDEKGDAPLSSCYAEKGLCVIEESEHDCDETDTSCDNIDL